MFACGNSPEFVKLNQNAFRSPKFRTEGKGVAIFNFQSNLRLSWMSFVNITVNALF